MGLFDTKTSGKKTSLFTDYEHAKTTQRGEWFPAKFEGRLRLVRFEAGDTQFKKPGQKFVVATFTVLNTNQPEEVPVGCERTYFVGSAMMFEANLKALLVALHNSAQLTAGETLTIPTQEDAEFMVVGRVGADGAPLPDTHPEFDAVIPGYANAGYEVLLETRMNAKGTYTNHYFKPCAFGV